ncbi:hypothetical protein [Wolbachia endosymbiont of Drosophila pseudotakahashii]|nr:hypothetical protein [Wolbachia endosymbiont of Drosophila pseudotakahashii]UZE38106.1 hypothetical protein ONI09_04190 [Wolbachia endosymbiont of Drosophila pseudotakahashii]
MNFVSNCQFFSLERCNKAHWDPVFFTNSPKVFHSITQNPYSPNPMHYL